MQSCCSLCGGTLLRAASTPRWHQCVCQDIKNRTYIILVNGYGITLSCHRCFSGIHASCVIQVYQVGGSEPASVCWLTASNVGTYTITQHGLLQSYSWEGYLIASQASTSLGTSTSAQDLLRKRYLGISGSNKLVGALEVQQVESLHNCLESQNVLPPLHLSDLWKLHTGRAHIYPSGLTWAV